MRRPNAGSLAVLFLCIAGMVHADGRDDHDHDRDDDHGDRAEVVTDTPPAATATMTLTKADNVCAWEVVGKVRKPYRGPGADVKLLCMAYNDLSQEGSPTVYSTTSCRQDVCPPPVDANGNFSMRIVVNCAAPQRPETDFCVFVVHVNEKNRGPGKLPGGDPNGSAPCSGGLCPNSI